MWLANKNLTTPLTYKANEPKPLPYISMSNIDTTLIGNVTQVYQGYSYNIEPSNSFLDWLKHCDLTYNIISLDGLSLGNIYKPVASLYQVDKSVYKLFTMPSFKVLGVDTLNSYLTYNVIIKNVNNIIPSIYLAEQPNVQSIHLSTIKTNSFVTYNQLKNISTKDNPTISIQIKQPITHTNLSIGGHTVDISEFKIYETTATSSRTKYVYQGKQLDSFTYRNKVYLIDGNL